ncbi:hypothetical protein Nepgr_022749 [Nepenthes gracilis]|uniref:Uncharacterized protein n=1 Tax=Nepenthes gracilis TaxID=150966 RepID=A0AAD3XX36_NEPGR|nr:hypothetical protein Nepgr_022749 [Nepenthes gracilis]
MKLPIFISFVSLGICLTSTTKRFRNFHGFSPYLFLMWKRCQDYFSSQQLEAYWAKKRSTQMGAEMIEMIYSISAPIVRVNGRHLELHRHWSVQDLRCKWRSIQIDSVLVVLEHAILDILQFGICSSSVG